MVIEILFPEFANLYGDSANVRYLKKCLPTAKFVETSNSEEPYFVRHDIDMLYIGSMSENAQLITIDKLRPYLEQFKALIEKNILVLCTGNALELFGSYILADGVKYEALDLFEYHAERKDNVRYNYMFVGEYVGMNIVGHKSQFSLLYGNFEYPFMKVIRGIGQNIEAKHEGICYKNFYATYVLGPLLILNPHFTKYLLNKLGVDIKLPFEEEMIAAYENRYHELMQDNAYINIGYHGC